MSSRLSHAFDFIRDPDFTAKVEEKSRIFRAKECQRVKKYQSKKSPSLKPKPPINIEGFDPINMKFIDP